MQDKNHDRIADAFGYLGWDVYDMNPTGQHVPGFPDIIVVKPGMTVHVGIWPETDGSNQAEKVFRPERIVQPEWADWHAIVRSVDDVMSVENTWRKVLRGRGITIDESWSGDNYR